MRARRIPNAVRLFLLAQWRCRFPHVYLGMSLVTVLAFRLAVPEQYAESLVPAFLLGEPGTLALTLVAAQAYLERGERSVTALAVTPLRSGEYVFALVLTSALVATAAGMLIQGGVLGVDLRLLLLLPPLLLTTTLAGFLGLGLSARFSEFTRFLVGGLMPAILVIELPYLSYFGLVPRLAFVWIPSDAALFGLANLARPDPDALHYALYAALLLGYNALAFRWARRSFQERVRERLERA
jgi:fluoroquinolone transport system permease protein